MKRPALFPQGAAAGAALTVTLALSTLAGAQAQEARAASAWALGPQWSQSSDSDGLSVRKPGLAAYSRWESAAHWQGLELQQQRYAQTGTTLEGRSLALVGQQVEPASWLGHGYKLGWSEGLAHSTWVADGFWSGAWGPATQWSLFGTRDRVESMAGLQAGLTFDLLGASLDRQLAPGLTLVTAATATRFSDDQDRRQLRLRMVWDALPEQGLTLQLQLKEQQGERDVAVRRYYNPGRLEEGLLSLGWRRRWEGWQLSARAGAGSQRVDGASGTPMRSAEAQLQSPLRGSQYLKLRLGWSDTLGLSGPGYTYRSADLSWVFTL